MLCGGNPDLSGLQRSELVRHITGGSPDLSGVIVDLRNTVIDKKSRGNQEVNWIK